MISVSSYHVTQQPRLDAVQHTLPLLSRSHAITYIIRIIEAHNIVRVTYLQSAHEKLFGMWVDSEEGCFQPTSIEASLGDLYRREVIYHTSTSPGIRLAMIVQDNKLSVGLFNGHIKPS